MISIFFTYRHIDDTWGGANTFIRNIRKFLEDDLSFKVVDSIEDCDIIFMNQLSSGPGNNSQKIKLSKIKKYILKSPRKISLVVRAVNLRLNVDFQSKFLTRFLAYVSDRKTIKLLNIADVVIFQSHYQYKVFRDAGYLGSNYYIINNAVASDFWTEHQVEHQVDFKKNDKLILVSASFSVRPIKRFDLISKISMLPDVRVIHIGQWPKDVHPGNVVLAGILNHSEMKKIFKKSHYFLHPAIRDACPNVILEALTMGLPVIYNSYEGSSAELVADAGIALDEKNLDKTIFHAKDRFIKMKLLALKRRELFRFDFILEKYKEIFIMAEKK